jgi:hypothetical protein
MPHNHGWETHYEFQDTMTLYRNKHQVKFGGEYMYVDIMQYSFYYGMGEWRFSDLTAFRAGLPTGFVSELRHDGPYLKVNNYSAFIQDEWQPTSKLTVNYGVRWDFNALPERSLERRAPRSGVQPVTEVRHHHRQQQLHEGVQERHEQLPAAGRRIVFAERQDGRPRGRGPVLSAARTTARWRRDLRTAWTATRAYDFPATKPRRCGRACTIRPARSITAAGCACRRLTGTR